MAMDFLLDTERPTSETKPTTQVFPVETFISRSMFKELPMDVQKDYARFYDLPNAERLATDEICGALFEETEWTPAIKIKGHVQLVTTEGVIVAKEVMDLVEWLVEHPTHAISSSSRIPRPGETYNNTQVEMQPDEIASNVLVDPSCTRTKMSLENLQKMAEELQWAHTRIKTAVEESRRAAHEACADVFILQDELGKEEAWHSRMVETIWNISGIEVVQGIKRRLDKAKASSDDNGHQEGGMESERRSPANVSYHVIPAEQRWTSPYSSPRGKKLKRTRDDDDLSDGPHKHKRPRLEDAPSSNHTSPRATVIPQTILDYLGEDEGTDDTYSDSNGTEGDFVDDPYSYRDSRRRSPATELREQTSWRRLSDDELSDEDTDTDGSQTGIPWGSISDYGGDSSDPDYQPPGWDLEDVWEIENPWNLPEEAHPLFRFTFADELFDCDGELSEDGLSTDDSDRVYRHPGFLHRPSMPPFLSSKCIFPGSLGPHLNSPPACDDATEREWANSDEERERFALLDEQARFRVKFSKWEVVRSKLQWKRFPPLDIEHRMAHLLESDHTQFYFDDEESKRFIPTRSWPHASG